MPIAGELTAMLELEKMLPITADKFADVTALVGYTVWQIQILERVLASHLVMVHHDAFKN